MTSNVIIVVLVAILITIIYIMGNSEEMRDAMNNFVIRQKLIAIAKFRDGTVEISEEPVGTVITADFALSQPNTEYTLFLAPHGGEITGEFTADPKDFNCIGKFTGTYTGESKVTLRGNRNALGRTLLLISEGKIVDSAHVLVSDKLIPQTGP